MRRLATVVLIAVILGACTPAIIGVSFALGGATVGVTYEILGDGTQDAGADR